MEETSCNCCSACAEACPSGAITIAENAIGCTLAVSYGKCIFCGHCTEVCPTSCLSFSQDYHLSTKNKADLVQIFTVTRD